MAETPEERAARLAKEALKREAMKVHPKPALEKIQKRIEDKKDRKGKK